MPLQVADGVQEGVRAPAVQLEFVEQGEVVRPRYERVHEVLGDVDVALDVGVVRHKPVDAHAVVGRARQHAGELQQPPGPRAPGGEPRRQPRERHVRLTQRRNERDTLLLLAPERSPGSPDHALDLGLVSLPRQQLPVEREVLREARRRAALRDA